ncbi:hypothetical protein WA845_23260 [Agrobacterium sp. CMT1]
MPENNPIPGHARGAIDVPDEFINCIGEFHGSARLNLIHRAQNSVLDLEIVGRFIISFFKPITLQGVPTPHDEVAFASSVAPNRGKQGKSFTANVEAPCLVGAAVEIDYQGLAAPIRARHDNQSGPRAKNHGCITCPS